MEEKLGMANLRLPEIPLSTAFDFKRHSFLLYPSTHRAL